MIDWTPEPIAFSLGPLTIYWYGVMYALGLAATFVVVEREARRRGLDTSFLVNGIIVISVAALVGGRLYHVIDQWELYKDDLLSIILPPYSGLGVYGGIVTGFIVGILYVRWKRQPVLTWTDVAVPGLLTMQAIARWGNFFNQELYGPPTDLPWGIPIQCIHRTATWLCPPLGTTPVDEHFHPLFLYESISGAVGAVVLLLLARRVRSLRPGDITLLFFVWYGTTRFLLEPLRSNNWTVNGVAVASIISATFVLGALAILAWRHRPGARRPSDETAAVEAAADEAPVEGASAAGDASETADPPPDGPRESASG